MYNYKVTEVYRCLKVIHRLRENESGLQTTVIFEYNV